MYKIIGADQKEYGPITADQLRQWIAEGRVNGETRIQPEGTLGWKRVAELPEFISALPAPGPAAIPPVGTPGTISVPPSGPTLAPGSYMPPPAPPASNQMAVWSMVTGIIGLLCCQILAPVAIVLGFVALSQIKQNPRQEGKGFAITGVVLGFISLLLAIAGVILLLSFPQAFPAFPHN